MNKRVLELAIKSIANVRFWNAEKEAYDVSHDELIEFAELIVNDVLNIVAISGEHCNCSTLFRKISEHFGVNK